VPAGSGDARVVIDGSGFERGIGPGQSFAVLGDDVLSTTYVRSTQLIAVIPAKYLAAPVTWQLFVVYGDTMSWSDGYRGDPRSNTVTFTVDARLSVSSITPTTALAGSGDTVVTIDGSGFTSASPTGPPQYSFAVWGDDELLTRFVSSSQLTAVIPAKFLITPTTAQLFVVNGDGMGWSDGYKNYPRSNRVTFTITAP
jgi:hypothetical protein